jgi:hypothetical protein
MENLVIWSSGHLVIWSSGHRCLIAHLLNVPTMTRSPNDQMTRWIEADVAQLAERVLGKDEVSSSILDIGSRDAIAARGGANASRTTHDERGS